MHTDQEGASEMDEDFCTALKLLRSSEDDSTLKLLKMLDASIEKRYGPSRTLIPRMSLDFLQGSGTCKESLKKSPIPRTRQVSDQKMEKSPDNSSSLYLDLFSDSVATESCKSMRIIRIVSSGDKEDIPRISIPDEGPGDEALCKVCNGSKLGPLILLECQDCQEVYHPLCHQPPVLDIDTYDPRLVWRCSTCTEPSVAMETSAADIRIKFSREEAEPVFEASSKSRALELFGYSRSNEPKPAGRNPPRSSTSRREAKKSLTRASTNPSHREGPTSKIARLRKRTALKLTSSK
ncbi:integrator complex subunit 12 [Orussus abietinus]|uniref:integrator complex subunit 12 n=1 Tax=Orussus abietinus TaxID=222816 RepID=UPI0006263044|nr:integrator complex subunit 12 [Orussus abietinus]XP_012279854.1 integrator complex subunit 12 [Orussus abietinus]